MNKRELNFPIFFPLLREAFRGKAVTVKVSAVLDSYTRKVCARSKRRRSFSVINEPRRKIIDLSVSD